MMMMITVITTKSRLVPLNEGLCAQILYFRFEIIGGLPSHLLLFFLERKNMLKNKSSQSKISSSLLACTYTCVLCTQIRTHVCRDLVYLDSSGPPGISSQPTPGLTTKYPICAVCVCVRTYKHLHPHTFPPALKIEMTETTPLFSFCQK